MQMVPLMKSLIGVIRKNLNEFLCTPLDATGFVPHYGTTLDKSTPIRETNQAIMMLVVVKGQRCAIPMGSPKVYMSSSGSVAGGAGSELGHQLIDTLLKFTQIDNEGLNYHMGKNHTITLVTKKMNCNLTSEIFTSCATESSRKYDGDSQTFFFA